MATVRSTLLDDSSSSEDIEKDTIPTYRNIQNGGKSKASSTGRMRTNASGTNSTVASYRQEFRVYPWRWLMLVAVSLLNVSNGMMWLSYSPVPSFTATYYSITVDDVDWFSIIYFIVSLIMGFVAIWILDKVGLKLPLYIGASLNLLGSGLRLLSSADFLICSPLPKAGFFVALLGQALTAVAQPFSLYAPTTLAAVWFGPKERALCTTLTSVANPIGIAIAQLASPYIVTTVDRLPQMLWIYTVPAGVTFVLILVAFWWKEPPIPPAPSGERDHIPPFLKGVKLVLKNWSFWVLLIFWGGAAGMFNALITLLPQILCPYGYSNTETGLWGALLIFFGLVGATVAGLIIDYTKMYKDVSVVSMGLALFTFVWFLEVYTLVGQPVLIAASLCVFGFFGLAQLPVAMELGVEITYPVAESISSGLLWSAAQVLGIVIVFVSQMLTVPMSPALFPINQCGSDTDFNSSSLPACHQHTHNASLPVPIEDSLPLTELGPTMIFTPSLISLLFVFYVIFFWPKYRRIAAERRANLEESLIVGNAQNFRT